MPPVFALALGLMGAAVLVRWCVKEVRRVNAELDDNARPLRRRADRPRRTADFEARSADGRVPAGLSSDT